MLMRTQFTTIAAIIGLAGGICAYAPRVLADDTDAMTLSQVLDNPSSALHLSPEQQAKVDARRKKFQTDARDISVAKGLSRDQKTTKLAELQKAAIADVKSYLTPDQRTQIDAQQADLLAKAKARDAKINALRARQQAAAADYKAQRQALLQSLTKDQMIKIKALEDDTNAAITKVRQNSALSKADQDTQVGKILQDHDRRQSDLFNADQKATIARMNALDADGEELQRQINLLNPAVIISPKL
ncbi:MAG TPA: hypothetical protein VGK19_14655 [Capsulimonadaceae bacterium]|jgi:hypothetical protein